MNQNTFISFFILVSVIFFVVTATKNVVPVFLWEKNSNVPLVPALQRINAKSFGNILLQHFHEDNHLLVFVKDSLSKEDFNALKSGDEVSRTKLDTVKDDNAISYFPFVLDPVDAVKQIYPTALEIPLSKLSDDILLNNKIIIVRLDDPQNKEDNSQNFKYHALKAFETYDKVAQSHKHVTGILTALRSSWISSEDKALNRKVRATEDGEADTRIVFKTNNTILYVNSPIIFYANDQVTSISAGSSFSDQVSNSTIVATLTGSATTITFFFELISGYWYLNNLTVVSSGSESDLAVKDVYAPTGFSYACNNSVFYEYTNQNYNLSLPGFQIQPFFGSNNSGSFGDPYNCVGFTSIPIWSGLFVTFILVLIMTFGLIFIFDIKTMDRFDDPKGKTITVNVTE
ncbi:V-type proton ATPase subunit S1 [Agrilus planipennis]|uniref:V-type proton ATPase subunit S1 n=1 Tax=Agrilus planipennis TaxID=224129 RepID=A0A1W4XGF7_AGRPL|nr:V-type proton ATPase subunit S1 [Agrilus planipennis]